MALNPAVREQVEQVFIKFIRNRPRAIQRLSIKALNMNPFLIRILAREMGLNDARSIVRWLVSQRLERGAVTSFGYALQGGAKVFSEGTFAERVAV